MERTLRGAAFALIAYSLWRLLQPVAAGSAVYADDTTLARDVASLTGSRATAVHLTLAVTPPPPSRDAIAALQHAGVSVTWSGRGGIFAPLALGAERIAEPSASVRIIAASSGAVEVADELSVLDTVDATRGSTVIAGAPSGEVRATGGKSRAAVSIAPPARLHGVLVIGRATWESKFTIAALEEAGWSVAARLSVAPGADVTQGIVSSLDTAHYSAVVALDSALGVTGAALARYVRSGGGLILAGEAHRAAAMREFAPATNADRRPSPTFTFDANQALRSLPSSPLIVLRNDAVPLDVRDGVTLVAARREGAGRVVQVGYEDLWRWRMQGGESGAADHRAWWSRLVSSVIAVPPGPPDAVDEGAPVARLYNALGVPTVAPPRRAPDEQLPVWLLPAIAAVLLAEWGSRRFRGAP